MREMKDSGIAWIGAIPNHWRVSKIKQIVRRKSVKGQPDLPVLSLYRDYGVIPKDSRDDNHNVTSLDTSGYKVVEHGDLVINKMKAWQGSLAVSEYNGIVSPAYHICKITSENICKKYLHYLLRDASYLPEYMRLSTGLRVGQWDLSFDDFKNIPFLVPSLAEQERIAAFLDAECAEIDAVLEKTRASIEEYKKLKQAVITQAVTKGIRGDRPMKDSGIEWIGEIPAEWSVVKGRRLILATQNGLTRRNLEKSEGFIVLKLKNLDADGNIDYSEVNRVALTDEEKSKYQLCDGDFLFVRVNGSRNLVGKCAIYHDVGEIVAYNDHIIRVKLNDLCLKEYFHYYLLSIAGKREIELHTSTAAGQFTISGDGLRELRVVLPGIVEQAETVAYLDKKSADIDALVAKKQQYLTEIENYKKSLIYEYVTGKREV